VLKQGRSYRSPGYSQTPKKQQEMAWAKNVADSVASYRNYWNWVADSKYAFN